MKQISKSRILQVSLIVLLFAIFFTGIFLYVKNLNQVIFKESTNRIKSFANVSVKNIVDAYLLYSNSGDIKLGNIISDLLQAAPDIKSIQIIDTEGKIVLDSKIGNFAQNEEETLKIEDEATKELLRQTEPTFLSSKNTNTLDKIVYPYLDDWGRHPYSVIFYPSYDGADKIARSIKIQAALASGFFAILALFLIVFTTQRREIELAREKRRFLEELDKKKNEFIMLSSHNLRTPLAALKGFFEMLKGVKVKPSLGKHVMAVSGSVKNLDETVSNMVAIAESFDQEEANFSAKASFLDIINTVVDQLRPKIREKNISIEIESKGDFKPIKQGVRKFERIIFNLLENAIKFNKENGEILISCQAEENNITFSVKDTGIGIAQNKIGELFQSFYQVQSGKSEYVYNYEGTGLGLYAAKILVESLGGKIWAQSQLGKGSTFYFTIPVED